MLAPVVHYIVTKLLRLLHFEIDSSEICLHLGHILECWSGSAQFHHINPGCEASGNQGENGEEEDFRCMR